MMMKTKMTKRMSMIMAPVAVQAGSLAEALTGTHDELHWHALDATMPEYAPRYAEAWLVRGRRQAFLCRDEVGYFVFEYEAEPVEDADAKAES